MKIEDLIYIGSMKYATKEEELIAVIFLNYYDLCIEQKVVNDQTLKLLDIEIFKQKGSISEENIRDFLYLISDEENYLYDMKQSDYFIKQGNNYILNTEKFEKENEILNEIFIYNGYINGASLSTVLKQLNSFKKLSLNERLLYGYIIQFGKVLNKTDDKYFIDLTTLSKEQLNIMNEIYNKNRKKIVSILYTLKDKLNEQRKVKILKRI